MATIGELLAASDPLRHKSTPDPVAREAMRRRVVAAAGAGAPSQPALSRRAFVVAAGTALVLAGIATGPAWWPDRGTVHAAVPFEVRLAERDAATGLEAIADAAGARRVYVDPRVVVANGDIVAARAVPVGSGFGVEITFTDGGTAKMRAATSGNVGRLLAVVVDGRVLASPRITSPIDGVGILGGTYTKEEAGRLAAGLVPLPRP